MGDKRKISVFTSIHNRAHLLQWCLEAIYTNTDATGVEVELNVMDSRSSDGLDSVLRDYSHVFPTVKKWGWDSSRTAVKNLFGCPAERYNVLVKLCSHDILWKTDPEMVILDPDFLKKALVLIDKNPNSFVMPFPYHCYEFPIENLEDIKDNYLKFHYSTHITKENAKHELVYYQSIFKKESYQNLGGIDERFLRGIGHEDIHFLRWWKKEYGMNSFIPLLDSPACHLHHGGMAQSPDSGTTGVPRHLYSWVEKNENLFRQLENTRPNVGQESGRLYHHITLTLWEKGLCVANKISICEARPDLIIFNSL